MLAMGGSNETMRRVVARVWLLGQQQQSEAGSLSSHRLSEEVGELQIDDAGVWSIRTDAKGWQEIPEWLVIERCRSASNWIEIKALFFPSSEE